MKRLTKDEYFMELAFTAARRSEDPNRKVGACAATAEGRVVGLAYNGLQAGLDYESCNHIDKELTFIHAEQNLCALFKAGEVETVAVTTIPCVHCMKLLVAHKVKRILYCFKYDKGLTAADVEGVYKDLEFIRIEPDAHKYDMRFQ